MPVRAVALPVGNGRRWVVRLGIRTFPWLLAAVGLGGILLIVTWIVIREQPASRRERMKLPALLLPVLFVLGFVGGWYLIPADVAWLLVEFTDRRGRDGVPRLSVNS